jgi:hypothetical protein
MEGTIPVVSERDFLPNPCYERRRRRRRRRKDYLYGE